MRTTTRGLYALRAMVALARNASEAKPRALHALAAEAGISPEFLQQIFHRLRKAGLVSAYRGPGGGFYLAKEPGTVSVLEILEAAGESFEISPCKEAVDPSRQSCPNYRGCSAGQFWSNLEAEMRRMAGSTSLAGLMRKEGKQAAP